MAFSIAIMSGCFKFLYQIKVFHFQMGCDWIPKLSIRLRNVVLETSLTVLQILIMLFRSSALKSFWKRDNDCSDWNGKIQRHNEVLFCIQFGESSIWSWINTTNKHCSEMKIYYILFQFSSGTAHLLYL